MEDKLRYPAIRIQHQSPAGALGFKFPGFFSAPPPDSMSSRLPKFFGMERLPRRLGLRGCRFRLRSLSVEALFFLRLSSEACALSSGGLMLGTSGTSATSIVLLAPSPSLTERDLCIWCPVKPPECCLPKLFECWTSTSAATVAEPASTTAAAVAASAADAMLTPTAASCSAAACRSLGGLSLRGRGRWTSGQNSGRGIAPVRIQVCVAAVLFAPISRASSCGARESGQRVFAARELSGKQRRNGLGFGRPQSAAKSSACSMSSWKKI